MMLDRASSPIFNGNFRAVPSSPSTFARSAQKEHMLATAVESANHPVITIRAIDGTIAAWNPAAERIYQYTAAEAIGNNIAIIVPPDRPNEHIRIFASLLTGEPIEEFETIRLTKDGQKVGVALSARPVISPSGEIVGVTTI